MNTEQLRRPEVQNSQNTKFRATLDEVNAPVRLERRTNRWIAEFEDQNTLEWDSMTGPGVRSKQEWIDWCARYLGVANTVFDTQNFSTQQEVDTMFDNVAAEVASLSRRFLVPNIVPSQLGQPNENPRVIFHAGSRATGDYKNEYQRIRDGIPAPHFDIWTGARAGFFAKSGDMVIGRRLDDVIDTSRPGVQYLEVDNYDKYYTYDALADWADQDPFFEDNKNPIPQIINFLNQNPDTSISIYASGFEEQAVLLYLLSLSNLDKIKIEANSPQVDAINHKAILYPDLSDVLSITDAKPRTQQEVLDLLRAEKTHSQLVQMFGEELLDIMPGVPGCTIQPATDAGAYTNQIQNLKKYFYDRYGITKICAKPAVSADGEGIIFGIDPRNPQELDQLVEQIFRNQRPYVFEPHLNFSEYILNGVNYKVVPSSHVINGYANIGLGTNQKVSSDGVWMGHDLLNPHTARELGLGDIFERTQRYMQTIADRAREQNLGLSIAGIDFFEATIDSDNPAVACMLWSGPGDPNIRLTGASYVYSAFETALNELQNNGIEKFSAENLAVSTRIFTPNTDFGTVDRLVEDFNSRYSDLNHGITFGTIASCVDGWGMIYASGDNVATAADLAERLVAEIKTKGLGR